MNGIDRMRSDLQKLKDAISMPAEDTVTRSWQKTIDFVDGLKGKLQDEESAVIRRYVEKRSREAAQAQATVTPVDTVQHSSPCPLDPEPSSSVCVKLDNNEVKMDPERGELESPSAGTGLETPGQQCPPNEGIWETGRTTASGILIAGVGSCQGGNISSPTERIKSTKNTATFAGISLAAATPQNRRHKTSSEENKQFDPGGKGEKAPPWYAAVTLLSFSGESWEAPCLCFVCFSVSALFVLSFLNYCSFRWPLFSELKDMRGDADQVADVRNRRASIFSPITLLKMARTNNARFGHSGNALG